MSKDTGYDHITEPLNIATDIRHRLSAGLISSTRKDLLTREKDRMTTQGNGCNFKTYLSSK